MSVVKGERVGNATRCPPALVHTEAMGGRLSPHGGQEHCMEEQLMPLSAKGLRTLRWLTEAVQRPVVHRDVPLALVVSLQVVALEVARFRPRRRRRATSRVSGAAAAGGGR